VVNRFSASLIEVGILYTVFCIVAAVFKIPAGKLVDLYGKEKIFFLSVMIGALCSLSYIFASNLLQLYIIEFFFGIAYALQRPSFLTLIVDLSHSNERGLFLGLSESAYDIATAAAALFSAIIVSQAGFEPLFLLSSGCQVISGFFILELKK
jgi:MFS family permease